MQGALSDTEYFLTQGLNAAVEANCMGSVVKFRLKLAEVHNRKKQAEASMKELESCDFMKEV